MRKILFIALSILLFSCKSDLTQDKALEQLAALPEFEATFYAPFHIGNEILNGDNHKNTDRYIKEHLGSLIEAGLVEAKVVESNSWRSVMSLSLTEKGKTFADPKRSTEKSVHVQACKVTPTEIVEMKVLEEDKTVEVTYIFTESEVTPFGTHLGFENGKTHKDTRTFVRMGFGWEIR